MAGFSKYQAPEMKLNHWYSTKADIWSAGLISFFLLNHGQLPKIENENTDLTDLESQ